MTPMRIALICTDKPGHLPLRLATREAHLAWLAARTGLELAGPFLDGDGQPNGSLIVTEAPDLAEARIWAATDPYSVAGLFAEVQVREWKKVIG
jgi:uncharacterized protein